MSGESALIHHFIKIWFFISLRNR